VKCEAYFTGAANSRLAKSRYYSKNICRILGRALLLGCFMKNPGRLFKARFENGFSSILISIMMPL
jgi:hypothetical protein